MSAVFENAISGIELKTNISVSPSRNHLQINGFWKVKPKYEF